MPFSYICAIILVNKRCSDASNERQRHNQTQQFLLIFAGLLFLIAVLLPLMYILLPKGKTVSIRYYENTLILHPGSIRK